MGTFQFMVDKRTHISPGKFSWVTVLSQLFQQQKRIKQELVLYLKCLQREKIVNGNTVLLMLLVCVIYVKYIQNDQLKSV